MALSLAKEEGNANLLIVELAALLHDVRDYKYSGSDIEATKCIRDFFISQEYEKTIIEAILNVIAGIGFKHSLEVGHRAVMTPELACVQDADRLDAIGAVGIARCFTFGGARKRPLYVEGLDPRTNLSVQEYANKDNGATINHFYEKLLHLKSQMNTEAGKRKAQGRHDFMVAYLAQFNAEKDGVS